VEHAQDEDGTAVVPILECVSSAQCLEEELAILIASAKASSDRRMSTEQISPLDELACDARGEIGKTFVKKCGESIDVCQRVQRPRDR
jgi:hypothetical protein